jgi:ribosomal protein L14
MTSSIGGKNKCVLIKEVSSGEIELLGTTIKDPICKELERIKGLEKIVELSEEQI